MITRPTQENTGSETLGSEARLTKLMAPITDNDTALASCEWLTGVLSDVFHQTAKVAPTAADMIATNATISFMLLFFTVPPPYKTR